MRAAFRGPCRLERGARVLVAASGGADSTALLAGLHRIAPELGIELSVAHLHHGLRGIDADRDLEQVRALCARLAVGLISARWDTRRRMRARGLSGQAGLRILRREFLAASARRAGATAIATAHTADDQLETLLMRLVRGTGLAGLGGMAPRRGRWLKPLLLATRHDIESDLVRARLAWREDGSNADRHYLRNRLRHDIVPALALDRAHRPAPGPRVDAAPRPHIPAIARARLARSAAAIAAEVRSAAGMVERRAARTFERVCPIPHGEFRLDSGRVASYPLALRRSLVRRLWKRFAPAAPGLTRRHLESIDGLLGACRNHARVELPGGFEVERYRNWLCWRRRSSATRAGAPHGSGR